MFGFEVPAHVPGFEEQVLDPRSTGREPEAYDRRAAELAGRFRDDFEEKFAGSVDRAITSAGPRVD